MEYQNNNRKYLKFLAIIPMIILGITAFSYLVMLLWNWLMPALFNLPSISLLQALGLFILSKILLSPFNFNGRRRERYYNRQAFKERMMQMSDEERKAFKEQWKQRCQKP